MLYPRYAFALLAAEQNRWKKRGYQIRLGCITFMPLTKHNLFHNIDLILFLLGHAHTHTTHSERHKKAVMRNFLKFSAGFFMAFPVVELCPWHYHEYFHPPSPQFCAFDTFPFADLKRTFHFAPQLLYAFPFFRFSVFRSLRSESAFGKGQVEIMFLC